MDDDNDMAASKSNDNVSQDTQNAQSHAPLAQSSVSDDTSVEGADEKDDSDYVDQDSEGEGGNNTKKLSKHLSLAAN